MHIIASKAVAFKEASLPSFKIYQEQVVKNAKALGAALIENGLRLVSGGTDTHLLLVNYATGVTEGTKIALIMSTSRRIKIRSRLRRYPLRLHPLRLRHPAVTTRGMKKTRDGRDRRINFEGDVRL